ncbi:MAG: histidine phosphatase family protein [Dehalococcoidia bacterium]
MNISPRHLYLIRHCAAAGQEPDAPLTDAGQRQAVALADVLAAAEIDRIVSSPFRRARDSIAPLAQRAGITIDIDDRFAERVLGSGFDDWRSALRATFDDPNLCFEGGESSAIALARGVAALQDALDAGSVTAVVTHGNLLALLLRHFDPHVGYAEWEGLTNPDVYRVTATDGGGVTERIWH